MKEGGEDDDKGMVSDIDSVWSLGGREMPRSIRDGICVCVAVVVIVVVVMVLVVVALTVAMRLVVLMVMVGILLFVMAVRVSCIGVVGVVGVLCIGALEVDCAVVVDILVLGRVFVVEVAEGKELVVRCVVRLVLCCVKGRGYILCFFNMKSVEMNGLSVGGFPFGMVI